MCHARFGRSGERSAKLNTHHGKFKDVLIRTSTVRKYNIKSRQKTTCEHAAIYWPQLPTAPMPKLWAVNEEWSLHDRTKTNEPSPSRKWGKKPVWTTNYVCKLAVNSFKEKKNMLFVGSRTRFCLEGGYRRILEWKIKIKKKNYSRIK